MKKLKPNEKHLMLADSLQEVPLVPSSVKEWTEDGAYIPRCIYEDWYYVKDSLGNTYIAYFLNRCSGYMDYYKNKPLTVPPEKHHCRNIDITIDDNTDDVFFQIVDRYSVMCLDVSAINTKFRSFKKQEEIKMDNNVNNDAVAARRRALAEALRTGEPVVVTASGEVEKKDDAADQGLSGIQVPDGKLA